MKKFYTFALILLLSAQAFGQRAFVSNRGYLSNSVPFVPPSLEDVCPESGPNPAHVDLEGFAGDASHGNTKGGCQSGRILIRIHASAGLTDDSPATTRTGLGCNSQGLSCTNAGADGKVSIVEFARLTDNAPAAVGLADSGIVAHATGRDLYFEGGRFTLYLGDPLDNKQGAIFRRIQFLIRKDDPAAVSDDVILHSVRIFNGTDTSFVGNCLLIQSDKVIVQGSSFAWPWQQQLIDLKGVIGGGSPSRVTLTRNLLFEPGGEFNQPGSSSGHILQYDSVAHTSFFRNTVIQFYRMPELGIGKWDAKNNVFYNNNLGPTTVFHPGCEDPCGGGATDANFVNNRYVPGPDSTTTGSACERGNIIIDNSAEFISSSSIHVAGNIGPGSPDDGSGNGGSQTGLVCQNNGTKTIAGSPVGSMPSVTTTTAMAAYNDLIVNQNVGARYPCHTSVELERINHVLNNTGYTDGDEVESYPDVTQPCPQQPQQPRGFVSAQRVFTNNRIFM